MRKTIHEITRIPAEGALQIFRIVTDKLSKEGSHFKSGFRLPIRRRLEITSRGDVEARVLRILAEDFKAVKLLILLDRI